MIIKQALKWAEVKLSGSPSARLDAELLLAHITSESRTHLFAHDQKLLTFFELIKYKWNVWLRKKGWPVAYLTGQKEFYGLDFQVNRHVLIPRVDTEILVDEVVRESKERQDSSQLLIDVGTGSGCITVSILKTLPRLRGIATDVSASALCVARQNAIRHHVADRLSFRQMDLMSGFSEDEFDGKELWITANLPYVPSSWPDHPSTFKEPSRAIFTEDDGLFLYKKFIQNVKKFKPTKLFIESFDFQISPLKKLLDGYRLSNKKKMTGRAFLSVFDRKYE